MSAWVHALKTYFQQPCCCLSIDTDLAAAVLSAGGIDALLAVAGAGAEPVLAAAAMQTLTALVGSADAKALLLQHPSFLESLLSSMHTGKLSPPASTPL